MGGAWGGVSVLSSPPAPGTPGDEAATLQRAEWDSAALGYPSLPIPHLQESGPSGRMAIAGWMNRPMNVDPHGCPRRWCLGPRSRPADQGVQCPDQKSSSADRTCVTAGARPVLQARDPAPRCMSSDCTRIRFCRLLSSAADPRPRAADPLPGLMEECWGPVSERASQGR